MRYYFEAMQQQNHGLPPGQEGATQQSSIQGGSAPRSSPLPFEIL